MYVYVWMCVSNILLYVLDNNLTQPTQILDDDDKFNSNSSTAKSFLYYQIPSLSSYLSIYQQQYFIQIHLCLIQ